MKNIIYFDLDGTISDSAPGIIDSVKYALSYFRIDEKDEKKLNLFIGPPLFDAFSAVYGMTKEDADRAVEKYRENYNKNGAIYNFNIYDGVEDMLKALKKASKKLYIATAKPTEFAKKILDRADLSKYFDNIYGASFDETRRTKTAVIEYAIKENNHKKSDILMVGDRENDVTGAKNNGIDVLGVLYGYGSQEELKDAGCKNIVKTPKEVAEFIIEYRI